MEYFIMSTMYQLNDLYVTKDLVFGWAVSSSGEKGSFYSIPSIETETLQMLYEVAYPAYMPKEFKQSIYDELESRRLLDAQKSSEEIKPSDLINPVQKSSRLEDKYALLSEIVSKMTPIDSGTYADLGYLIFYVLNKEEREYEIVYRAHEQADQHKRFQDLDECLQYILKQWW